MTQKMIHLGSVLLVAVLLATLAPVARAQALSRCSITAINESTGIVSAKVNESGAVFQFKVTDAKLLAGLHVGQDVYANFTTRQVSLDGKKMCCEITSPPQAPAPVSAPPASAPAPVTAPKNASPAASAPAPVSAPPASVPAANPAPEASVAPLAVSATANKAAPAGPSSTITAIDAKAHVVTAKENGSGKTFEFKLDDAALLNTLKVGQGVYANFGASKVSLDGLEACGDIIQLPGPGSASGSTATGSASSGNSGTSGNTGATNTQQYSCGGTTQPLTADNCSKNGVAATFVFTATCGASITITGNVFPAGSSDWLQFYVPAPRSNCTTSSTGNQLIAVSLSSNPPAPNGIVFSVFSNLNGTAAPCGNGNCLIGGNTGPAVGVPQYAELGVDTVDGLQPGSYFIQIYSLTGSTVGTWTLKIMS